MQKETERKKEDNWGGGAMHPVYEVLYKIILSFEFNC